MINIEFKEQNIDNCLFDYDGDHIQLKFEPNVFLKVTDFANYEFQSAILKNFDLFQQNLKNNPAIVGYLLQSYILRFLKNFNVVGIKFQNSKVSKFDKSTNDNGLYSFYHFLSYLNGKYVMSLQQRLKSGLQSKNAKQQTFFFQPIALRKEKESLNNPSVDLLILKKIETDKYEITTVDFTVKSKTSQIKDKKLTTQTMIKKVFEKYYGTDSTEIKPPKIIKWNHIIAANLPSKVEDAKLNYPVFEFFQAPISYPNKAKQPQFPEKAEFSVKIVSIHNLQLYYNAENQDARVYSQLISKVLKLTKNLRQK